MENIKISHDLRKLNCELGKIMKSFKIKHDMRKYWVGEWITQKVC